jgi:hypothetical protein
MRLPSWNLVQSPSRRTHLMRGRGGGGDGELQDLFYFVLFYCYLFELPYICE